MAYTTRFDWLGAYYRDQERLMEHWKSLLPGTILDVSYEALVTDQSRWFVGCWTIVVWIGTRRS